MQNPEQRYIESLQINQIHERAKDALRYKINLDEFLDLYGKDVVEHDKNYVERKKEIFKQRAKEYPELIQHQKIGEIFEGLLYEHGELSNWLGDTVSTIKTSDFDDIANGVDIIAEFPESDISATHLGLAIDVTTSQEILKKFDRIMEEIENGKLARIKYFISEHLNFRGEISMIPRVIIAASQNTVLSLGEMWVEGENKKLSEHWIQFQILEEIKMQLEVFAKYASYKNQTELVKIYEKTLHIINQILEQKKSLNDDGTRDESFSAIETYLMNFKHKMSK